MSMEVMSVISDREDLKEIFKEVLENYPEIIEVDRYKVAINYRHKKDKNRELRFYYNEDNKQTIYYLKFDLTDEDMKRIKEQFGKELDELYVFEVEYTIISEKMLRGILRAFQEALLSRGISLSHVLIDHPFEGLKRLEELVCEEEDDEEGFFTKMVNWLEEKIKKIYKVLKWDRVRHSKLLNSGCAVCSEPSEIITKSKKTLANETKKE